MSVFELVQNAFKQAIEKACTSIDSTDEKLFEVKLASNEKFGHYQCNSAMKLAKIIGKNPRKIAEEIVLHLQEPLFLQVDIAGPGFINVHLSPELFSKQLQTLVQDDRLGIPKTKDKQRIIVEFSSPNVAKELHVAHLRSTIIGDTIARLFEFLGHDVLRLNHIGDWGTPFGMLIAYLKEYEPEILNGNKQAHLSELQDWYKASRKLFDEKEEFKKKAHQEVVKLQAKEQESMEAWKIICQISRKAFETIYDLLGVRIEERGESFYEPYLPQIIKQLEAENLITISNGAKCVFMSEFKGKDNAPLPLITQKSDGGYNYATTDLAGFWHRTNEEKADRIVIVTDGGQALHFKMVFEAAKRAHFVEANTQFDHVTFGLVLGEDGKKIKTRSGEVFRLIDLLEDAIIAAKEILQQREGDFSSEEIDNTARVLGIDAVKYADLSTLRTKDYTFSYERMLRFEGNTAAFLLYSYVRCLSIQKKSQCTSLPDLEKLLVEHPSEVSLAYHLCQFGDVLYQISQDLYPNALCDYLYTLAEKFNLFFRDCQVIGSKEQDSRLLIVEAVRKVFERGFQILGLETVRKM